MRKLLMVSVNRYDVLPSFDASKRIDVQYSQWCEEWMVKITTEFDCFGFFANQNFQSPDFRVSIPNLRPF